MILAKNHIRQPISARIESTYHVASADTPHKIADRTIDGEVVSKNFRIVICLSTAL